MPPPNDAEDRGGSVARSRHHYELAHFAFRKACATNPLVFFGVMGSQEQDAVLRSIWEQVRANCDESGEPTFDVADITIGTVRIKNRPVIVVVMPPPAAVAEAYLVAIVLHVDLDANDVPDPIEFDYWTLEKGMCLDGSDRTVLGRWTTDDTHHNFGDGPSPNVPEFLACVESRL